MAFHSSTGNLCGIPSNLIVDDLVEGNKVEIDSIVTSLKQVKRKIKDFQKGDEVMFKNVEQLDDNDVSIHVLIFEQIEGKEERVRLFLCNKGKNDNFEILNDLCHSMQDPKLSAKRRYIKLLLHQAAWVLRDCLQGTLFPLKISCLETLSVVQVDENPPGY